MNLIQRSPLTPFQYWNRRVGEISTVIFLIWLALWIIGPSLPWWIGVFSLGVAVATMALSWKDKRMW